MRKILKLVALLLIIMCVSAGDTWECKPVEQDPIGGPPTIIGNNVYLKNLTSGKFACIYKGKVITNGDKAFTLSLKNGKAGLNMVGVTTETLFNEDTHCGGYFYSGDTTFGTQTIQKYFGDRTNRGSSSKEDVTFRVEKKNDIFNVYIKHMQVSLGQAFNYNDTEAQYPVVCLEENAVASFQDIDDKEVDHIPKQRKMTTPRGTYNINKYYGEQGAQEHLSCKHRLTLTTVYYGIINAKKDELVAEKYEVGFENSQVLGYMKYTNNKWSFEKQSVETGPCINFIEETLTSDFNVYFSIYFGLFKYINVLKIPDKSKSFQAP